MHATPLAATTAANAKPVMYLTPSAYHYFTQAAVRGARAVPGNAFERTIIRAFIESRNHPLL